MKLDEIKKEIMREAKEKCKTAERHYQNGKKDCMKGYFDKWYRYNATDQGQAYEAGWVAQNIITQNEEVKFIEFVL